MAGANGNRVSGKINVLVVDDSAVMRQMLTGVLEQEPDIRVLGAAADPIFAMQRMRKAWPDVILLDIEMPRMDGLTFLRKIMSKRPTPIVICSSLTEKGTESAIRALAAGAVAVVAKPMGAAARAVTQEAFGEVIQAVRAAGEARFSQARPEHRAGPGPGGTASTHSPGAGTHASTASCSSGGIGPLSGSSATGGPGLAPRIAADQAVERERSAPNPAGKGRSLIAIGASTGGTQALHRLLAELPAGCPGIVIVQHMPEKFTASFAQRLDECCEISVREARDGDEVTPGLALIAPGGRHMKVIQEGAQLHVKVFDAPAVNRHRPSVDVLFRSVARHAGKRAIGLIMTGMGSDGAAGLKEMRASGARTIAQDESSCVVYGMPKEAVRMGAVEISVPLSRMAEVILENT